jgi:uncharacterized YccA/Bax inhibitor family protein
VDFTTSNNPLLTRAFKASALESQAMTFEGTANKTLGLCAVIVLGAAIVISFPTGGPVIAVAAAMGGLGIAIATAMNPKAARVTAVPWSLLQGVFLGSVSVTFEGSTQGIVGVAVALTAAAFLTMLVAYRSGLIRPSQRFRAGVVGATGAIALVYVVNFVLELGGVRSIMTADLGGSGVVGTGATLIVLAVAVLNLVLDFDFIEQAVAKGAPKSMEWFASFSITVTLVWIYIQFLDLLGGED